MTDQELLTSIAARDSHAFKLLYDTYHKTFFGWAYSRVSDWDAAADLMQEFWVHVWEHPSEIKTDAKGMARSYLARNLSFRVLRYFHRVCCRQEVAEDAEAAQAIEQMGYCHIEEEMDVKEIQEVIDTILQKMPPLMRRVYELRCLEHYSVKETACILHLNEGTVRNKLSSTLSALRKELAMQYEAHGWGHVQGLFLFLLTQWAE